MGAKCAAILGAVLIAIPIRAAESTNGSDRILESRIEQLARSFPGKVGVYARQVETGRAVAYGGDDLFPMASTYKVAIMVEVFREADEGRLSLDERVTTGEANRRLGSGLLSWMKPGLSPTIYDLVLLMISVSDNEATDILLHRVGPANVTATLRKLGIADMRVDRTTQEIIRDWVGYVDPASGRKSVSDLLAPVSELLTNLFQNTPREKIEEADREFTNDPRDHASPHAMTDLVTKIVLEQAASPQSCQQMLNIMKQQQFLGRIPRYLENQTIAGKNGTLQYTTNDVGVIFAGKQHIVLTIYTLKQNSSVTTEEAEDRIGRIARVIFDYFQDVSPGQ